MVTVEGGTFTMGSNIEFMNAQPAHSVTLSSFKISKYEVLSGTFFCLNCLYMGFISNIPTTFSFFQMNYYAL